MTRYIIPLHKCSIFLFIFFFTSMFIPEVKAFAPIFRKGLLKHSAGIILFVKSQLAASLLAARCARRCFEATRVFLWLVQRTINQRHRWLAQRAVFPAT